MPLHYDTHRDESLYLCDHWSFDSQQHNGLGLTALLSEMIEAGALVLFGLVSSSPQMIHANGGQSGIRRRGGCKVINRVFERLEFLLF